MAEKLRIFVSATRDLDAERSIIGRAVAQLPVQIGIEIRRTPVDHGSYDDMFELIANCDRVYFLLGKDITAPAGAEWHLAWKLERSVYPLRIPARLTPAAREFLRTSLVEWTFFRSGPQLFQLITSDLYRILNHPTNRYGLSVNELELLTLHTRQVEANTPAPTPAPEPGGAEGGGILIDTVHQEPVEGTLVEADS